MIQVNQALFIDPYANYLCIIQEQVERIWKGMFKCLRRIQAWFRGRWWFDSLFVWYMPDNCFLYACVYVNREMWIESNEMLMCEYLHAMNYYLTMWLCVLFITGWLWLYLCLLDQVSHSDTYIRSGVTFRHIFWTGCHVPTHTLDRVSHLAH